MKRVLLASCAILLPLTAQSEQATTVYAEQPAVQAFVKTMVDEHGFEASYIEQTLAGAQRKQKILDAISRPAEKTKSWADYRKIFLGQKRIDQGRAFIVEHRDTLLKAEQEFGVPKEIIAAIIGVETRYGRHKGSYRVIDSLATLAFDYPPRSPFFTSELAQYFLLAKEQQFSVDQVKGSYAGAMGLGQFISSSYRHYAVDYDGDGVADIINNPVDAIASVANYFSKHGWQQGQPVTFKTHLEAAANRDIANGKLKPKLTVAELAEEGYLAPKDAVVSDKATAMILQGADGEEVWLGMKNFYVITRYNHSHLYAMAVYQLSRELG